MKKTAIVIGITALSVMSIAQAAELPRYDPNKYCERISSLSGGSATLANECIKMEQSSYNKLKNMWIPYPRKLSPIATDSPTLQEAATRFLKAALIWK